MTFSPSPKSPMKVGSCLAAALLLASGPALAQKDGHFWRQQKGPAYGYEHKTDPKDPAPGKVLWVLGMPVTQGKPHDPDFSSFALMRDADVLPNAAGTFQWCNAMAGSYTCSVVSARQKELGKVSATQPVVPGTVVWQIVEDISKQRLIPATDAQLDALMNVK